MYQSSVPWPHPRRGSISISSKQYSDVIKRLEPYRRHSVPFTEQSGRDLDLQKRCVNEAYDAGPILVRWIGPAFDKYFFARSGCKNERDTALKPFIIAEKLSQAEATNDR